MSHCIAISLGDVTGVGPEVALKALASELKRHSSRYLILGDPALIQRLDRKLELGLPLDRSEPISVRNPLSHPLPEKIEPGAADAARAALAWLREGAKACLEGEADALVTAPVNKEAIMRAGEKFVGQTEYLSMLANAERTAMMLLGADDRDRWLRVALATTHLPIREVAVHLTQEKVERAISLAVEACHSLGLKRSRVGVCGLNPHAGEGGQLGTEEITVIAPAVRAAQKQGLDVSGPYAADTLFYHAYRGDYDAVVAMYHDQGLAPLKMIAFERGVNWTLGLPFVRTSPDHGTAYDIAGKGIADPSSMIAAIQLARQLCRKSGDCSPPATGPN
ncbi:MAG: 4-hydroxythreonine-4-phosphate dehydrogenase PdxA [Verrucomicrobia subdivision 3 bacterium]|nr:4-hydroxythreonine-4-phosphate dehydrogenase PdxA [Limisphaerales bacterium]